MLVHQDVTEGIEDDDSNSGITMKTNLGGKGLRRGYQGQRRKEGNKGGSKQGQGLQNMSKNSTRRKGWRNRLSQQHSDQRIQELNSQYVRIIVRKNFFQEKSETIEST